MKEDKPRFWRRISRPKVTARDISERARQAEEVTTRHARRFLLRRLDSLREVRRHVFLWLIVVGAIIGAAGLQLVWYQQGYKTKAGQVGGTYSEAVLGSVGTLNPIFTSTKAEESAARLMFSSLFKYDKTGGLVGDLATSFKVDKNGTRYTVKLRTDATWHDGFRVTAKDVVFTVGLFKDAAVRSTNPEDWSSIDVKAVDDETVVFELPSILAAFQHSLTFSVLPRHSLSSLEPTEIRENSFSQQPVGSGPFKIRLLQDLGLASGRKIIYLDRNSDYYGGKPKLERIQLRTYESQEAMVQALNVGEVNAVSDLSVLELDKINREKHQVSSVPINSGVYAILNTKRTILQDRDVRSALRLATSTKAIRDLFEDEKPSLYLPFVRGQLSGNVPAAPKYSLSQAKKVLDKAGWKLKSGVRTKSGKKLELTVVATKGANHERVLESLAGQWRELGILVDTVAIDLDDQGQRQSQDLIQSRNYDAIIYTLNIGADPDVFAYWHSSQSGFTGFNLSNYENDIADDALASARFRLESNIRNAKYLTFARQWLKDIPAIGLYQATTYYVHGKNDRVFDDDTKFISPLDRYSNVLYWSVGLRSVYKTP